MQYLHNDGMRAINPEFEAAFKAYERSKKEKAAPVGRSDAEALKEALAVFGIRNGTDLAEVLYDAGLIGRANKAGTGEAKDRGRRTGQSRYKDLTKLTRREYEALYCHCLRITEDLWHEAHSIAGDLEHEYRRIEHRLGELWLGFRAGGYTEEEYNEEAAPLLKEQQEVRRELREVWEDYNVCDAALEAFRSQQVRRLDAQTAVELEQRALIEGMGLLGVERRRALLMGLQGMLMAEYRAPCEETKEQARRAGEVCDAVDAAVKLNGARRRQALVDLVAATGATTLRAETDQAGNVLYYCDAETGEPIPEDTPAEAVLARYTAPRED